MNIDLIVLIVVCVISFAGAIITNPRTYCYLFEHKDWKRWKKVCQVLPELKLSAHYVSDDCKRLNNYKFSLPDIGISDKDLMVIYWETTNEVSVHEIGSGECILCPFDKYHSRKAVEILKQRI